MVTASIEHGQDHQIRTGKEPAFGLFAGRFGSASYESKMLGFGKVEDVLGADAREPGNLIEGEERLAGPYLDHETLSTARLQGLGRFPGLHHLDDENSLNDPHELRAIHLPFQIEKTIRLVRGQAGNGV